MRVVAGRYGGRRLAAPKGDLTRPTADRVREAVFSALGPLGEARVLDLFAGTGALGIEALSRGAASAVFVERDRLALTVLRQNLRSLEIEFAAADVRPGDYAAALRTARARGEQYDLVFLDPPYRLAAALGDELTAGLAGLLAPDGRVVAEMDRRAPLMLDLPLTLDRRYGDTQIRIHTPLP